MSDEQTNDEIRSLSSQLETITTSDTHMSNLNEKTVKSELTMPLKSSSSSNQEKNRRRVAEIEDGNNWSNYLPKPHTTEKIIFVIDTAKEADATPFEFRSGVKVEALDLIKRTIHMFITAKSGIQPKHEFALMTLEDQDVSWICDFTKESKVLGSCLENIASSQVDDFTINYDLGPCFKMIRQKIYLQNNYSPDSYTMRVIFIYNRSHIIPAFSTGLEEFLELSRNSSIYIDCLFVHESDENNASQEIYARLGRFDARRMSYIFEVSRNAALLHANMAKLIAHPLQRARQDNMPYSIYKPGTRQENTTVQTNV